MYANPSTQYAYQHLIQSEKQKEHGDSRKSPGSLRNFNLSVVGAQVRKCHLSHHISTRLWNHIIKEQPTGLKPPTFGKQPQECGVSQRKWGGPAALVSWEEELILIYKVLLVTIMRRGQHNHMSGDNKHPNITALHHWHQRSHAHPDDVRTDPGRSPTDFLYLTFLIHFHVLPISKI